MSTGTGKEKIQGGQTTGSPAEGLHRGYTGGAAHATPDGYFPDPDMVGTPQDILDLPNFTLSNTAVSPDTAEVVRVDGSAADWVNVTAVLIVAKGISTFKGCWVTVNKTSGAQEEAQLATTNNDGTGSDREYIPADTPYWIKRTDANITTLSFTGDDSADAADNNIQIVPF